MTGIFRGYGGVGNMGGTPESGPMYPTGPIQNPMIGTYQGQGAVKRTEITSPVASIDPKKDNQPAVDSFVKKLMSDDEPTSATSDQTASKPASQSVSEQAIQEDASQSSVSNNKSLSRFQIMEQNAKAYIDANSQDTPTQAVVDGKEVWLAEADTTNEPTADAQQTISQPVSTASQGPAVDQQEVPVTEPGQAMTSQEEKQQPVEDTSVEAPNEAQANIKSNNKMYKGLQDMEANAKAYIDANKQAEENTEGTPVEMLADARQEIEQDKLQQVSEAAIENAGAKGNPQPVEDSTPDWLQTLRASAEKPAEEGNIAESASTTSQAPVDAQQAEPEAEALDEASKEAEKNATAIKNQIEADRLKQEAVTQTADAAVDAQQGLQQPVETVSTSSQGSADAQAASRPQRPETAKTEIEQKATKPTNILETLGKTIKQIDEKYPTLKIAGAALLGAVGAKAAQMAVEKIQSLHKELTGLKEAAVADVNNPEDKIDVPPVGIEGHTTGVLANIDEVISQLEGIKPAEGTANFKRLQELRELQKAVNKVDSVDDDPNSNVKEFEQALTELNDQINIYDKKYGAPKLEVISAVAPTIQGEIPPAVAVAGANVNTEPTPVATETLENISSQEILKELNEMYPVVPAEELDGIIDMLTAEDADIIQLAKDIIQHPQKRVLLEDDSIAIYELTDPRDSNGVVQVTVDQDNGSIIMLEVISVGEHNNETNEFGGTTQDSIRTDFRIGADGKTVTSRAFYHNTLKRDATGAVDGRLNQEEYTRVRYGTEDQELVVSTRTPAGSDRVSFNAYGNVIGKVDLSDASEAFTAYSESVAQSEPEPTPVANRRELMTHAELRGLQNLGFTDEEIDRIAGMAAYTGSMTSQEEVRAALTAGLPISGELVPINDPSLNNVVATLLRINGVTGEVRREQMYNEQGELIDITVATGASRSGDPIEMVIYHNDDTNEIHAVVGGVHGQSTDIGVDIYRPNNTQLGVGIVLDQTTNQLTYRANRQIQGQARESIEIGTGIASPQFVENGTPSSLFPYELSENQPNQETFVLVGNEANLRDISRRVEQNPLIDEIAASRSANNAPVHIVVGGFRSHDANEFRQPTLLEGDAQDLQRNLANAIQTALVGNLTEVVIAGATGQEDVRLSVTEALELLSRTVAINSADGDQPTIQRILDNGVLGEFDPNWTPEQRQALLNSVVALQLVDQARDTSNNLNGQDRQTYRTMARVMLGRILGVAADSQAVTDLLNSANGADNDQTRIATVARNIVARVQDPADNNVTATQLANGQLPAAVAAEALNVIQSEANPQTTPEVNPARAHIDAAIAALEAQRDAADPSRRAEYQAAIDRLNTMGEALSQLGLSAEAQAAVIDANAENPAGMTVGIKETFKRNGNFWTMAKQWLISTGVSVGAGFGVQAVLPILAGVVGAPVAAGIMATGLMLVAGYSVISGAKYATKFLQDNKMSLREAVGSRGFWAAVGGQLLFQGLKFGGIFSGFGPVTSIIAGAAEAGIMFGLRKEASKKENEIANLIQANREARNYAVTRIAEAGFIRNAESGNPNALNAEKTPKIDFAKMYEVATYDGTDPKALKDRQVARTILVRLDETKNLFTGKTEAQITAADYQGAIAIINDKITRGTEAEQTTYAYKVIDTFVAFETAYMEQEIAQQKLELARGWMLAEATWYAASKAVAGATAGAQAGLLFAEATAGSAGAATPGSENYTDKNGDKWTIVKDSSGNVEYAINPDTQQTVVYSESGMTHAASLQSGIDESKLHFAQSDDAITQHGTNHIAGAVLDDSGKVVSLIAENANGVQTILQPANLDGAIGAGGHDIDIKSVTATEIAPGVADVPQTIHLTADITGTGITGTHTIDLAHVAAGSEAYPWNAGATGGSGAVDLLHGEQGKIYTDGTKAYYIGPEGSRNSWAQDIGMAGGMTKEAAERALEYNHPGGVASGINQTIGQDANMNPVIRDVEISRGMSVQPGNIVDISEFKNDIGAAGYQQILNNAIKLGGGTPGTPGGSGLFGFSDFGSGPDMSNGAYTNVGGGAIPGWLALASGIGAFAGGIGAGLIDNSGTPFSAVQRQNVEATLYKGGQAVARPGQPAAQAAAAGASAAAAASAAPGVVQQPAVSAAASAAVAGQQPVVAPVVPPVGGGAAPAGPAAAPVAGAAQATVQQQAQAGQPVLRPNESNPNIHILANGNLEMHVGGVHFPNEATGAPMTFKQTQVKVPGFKFAIPTHKDVTEWIGTQKASFSKIAAAILQPPLDVNLDNVTRFVVENESGQAVIMDVTANRSSAITDRLRTAIQANLENSVVPRITRLRELLGSEVKETLETVVATDKLKMIRKNLKKAGLDESNKAGVYKQIEDVSKEYPEKTPYTVLESAIDFLSVGYQVLNKQGRYANLDTAQTQQQFKALIEKYNNETGGRIDKLNGVVLTLSGEKKEAKALVGKEPPYARDALLDLCGKILGIQDLNIDMLDGPASAIPITPGINLEQIYRSLGTITSGIDITKANPGILLLVHHLKKEGKINDTEALYLLTGFKGLVTSTAP